MASTRRTLLSSAALALASACGRHKGSGYPGYAVIAAAGERALAVVDLLRFRHIRDIALRAEPRAVLAGPAGLVYALTPENGSIHQLTPELVLQNTRRLSETLTGCTLSATGKSLAAISSQARQLLVADATSLQVTTRHSSGGEPRFLSVGPPDYAAISTGPTGLIELFDLATGKRWRRQMPGEMGKLVFRPDGQILLAANLHDYALTALSVPDLRIVAELPLAMKPENLCFGSDGGQLFITGEGMDGVAIIFPYRVLQVDQTVLAGRDPGVMAASATPQYLFVASASGSDICIMNIDNRRVIGLVDVAQQPRFITVTPDSQYALVLNESSGDMAVIHISAIRQDFLSRSAKSGAALFTMLPVGDRPVHAIVVPAVA